MRGFVRIGLTVGALGLALALAGCEDFDPTAIFDTEFFNTKKPLPGKRVPVFPEGTPGVTQGVPPELVKGYQSAPEAAGTPQTTATATPKQAAAEPSEEKAKPKLKPKVKPKLVAKPEQQPTRTAGADQPNPPAPAAQSPWPDPPQTRQAAPPASAWPSSPQASGGVAWPDPPQTR